MLNYKWTNHVFIVAMFFVPSVALAKNIHYKDHMNVFQKLLNQDNIMEFSMAEIFLENNATDNDTEVVLMAKGGDSAINNFWIFSPAWRLIYHFKSPAYGNNIGGREIMIESPEPADLSIVLNAYPEGIYTFIGKDYNGQWLYSQAILVHDIPAPVTITYPTEEDNIQRYEFEVVWESVVPADHYLVELQNEETGEELLVEVPGDQTSFKAPEEWLVPGVEYQVSVGVVNEDGNITFVELNTIVSK